MTTRGAHPGQAPRPRPFQASGSARVQYVVWFWNRGPHTPPGWYARMRKDTLDGANAFVAYTLRQFPEQLKDGYVVTEQTTIVNHAIVIDHAAGQENE